MEITWILCENLYSDFIPALSADSSETFTPRQVGLNVQVCSTAALPIDSLSHTHLYFNPEIKTVYMGQICDSNYEEPERKFFIWYWFNSSSLVTSSSNFLFFYNCLCSVRLSNYSVTVTATNKRDVSSFLTENSVWTSEDVTVCRKSVHVLLFVSVISPILRKCVFRCRVLVAPSRYLSPQKH